MVVGKTKINNWNISVNIRAVTFALCPETQHSSRIFTAPAPKCTDQPRPRPTAPYMKSSRRHVANSTRYKDYDCNTRQSTVVLSQTGSLSVIVRIFLKTIHSGHWQTFWLWGSQATIKKSTAGGVRPHVYAPKCRGIYLPAMGAADAAPLTTSPRPGPAPLPRQPCHLPPPSPPARTAAAACRGPPSPLAWRVKEKEKKHHKDR